ncbi:MAG: hypothetical protein DMD65_01610 [Gemmatimonadetes bacterium]|nr:MAG: hypothetical protein DMD65_01610 [Gemmatimonadota bacterium]
MRVWFRFLYSSVSVASFPSVPSPLSILSSSPLSEPVASARRPVSWVRLTLSVSSRLPVSAAPAFENSVSRCAITRSSDLSVA